MTVYNDQQATSLCIWREARGEGAQGMLAVACVIRNRVKRRFTSYSIEVFRPWQFTSMTDASDPEYRLEPEDSDPTWQEAQSIAAGVISGATADITGGATLYWNPRGIKSNAEYTTPGGETVKFPQTWNPAHVRYSTTVGHHIFLTEV